MGRLVKNISGQSNVGSAQSLLIPSGTTAERPATPQAGMIRFNTSLAKFEFFNGTDFVNVTGGVGGAATITVDTFTILDELDNPDSAITSTFDLLIFLSL